MKTFVLVSIFAGAVALMFSGCHYLGGGLQGSGVRKTETRDLASFKSIESDGAFDIEVNCQKSLSLQIEGDDNILPLIKTEVRDGVLHIGSPKAYSTRQPVAVRIALPSLESIANNGAGSVRISNLKNEAFEIHSTGATSLNAAGQAKSVKIETSGAGTIDTSDLHAEAAAVSISGAASVDVYATDQLEVNVSGIGRVTYSGNPKTVKKNVSGVGSVSAKGGS